MAYNLFDRTIAFASICQAVKLVQDIAHSGTCDQEALRSTLNSIVVTNPASTADTFGGESALKIGLTALINEFNSSPSSNETTRYLINLISLERKLSSRRDSLGLLSDRISSSQRQLMHYDLLDDQMISNLASIYLDTISPLGPRIQVVGQVDQLQKTSVQHKVRALLLAGIRAAVLWRQVGGKRRNIIFGRKELIEQANIILARNS